MVKVLSRDSNNDLYIAPNGRLAISSDLEAVLQACEHAAKAQFGEMVLSVDTGVPNFQTIWRDATNIAQFEAYVRNAILSVEGVVEIKEFNAEVLDNRVQYRAEIVTIYGLGVLNG